MSNNLKVVLIIVFGIIALYIFNMNNDYNLNKSIEACLVAQKKTSKSFDVEKAKKFCIDEIIKKKKIGKW